jgi:hypothetical protein
LAKMFAHGHPHINIKHLCLSNNNILHIYIHICIIYYLYSVRAFFNFQRHLIAILVERLDH